MDRNCQFSHLTLCFTFGNQEGKAEGECVCRQWLQLFDTQERSEQISTSSFRKPHFTVRYSLFENEASVPTK